VPKCQRHFGTGAEVSRRHFGTGAEVSRILRWCRNVQWTLRHQCRNVLFPKYLRSEVSVHQFMYKQVIPNNKLSKSVLPQHCDYPKCILSVSVTNKKVTLISSDGGKL